MRAQLLHLSGRHRGRTITYENPTLLLGSSVSAAVRYPARAPVVERHAELRFVPEGCSFYLTAIDGQVFVNRREVREIILANDDLIELGINGPKLRFRICREGGRPCKPVRQMLRDAREVGSASGLAASTGSFRRDIITHSTWPARVSMLIVAAILASTSAYVGGWIGGNRTVQRESMLRQGQAVLYERQIDAIRAELETFRREQAGNAPREEVEALRIDLARRAKTVDRIVEQNAALTRVLDEYSRGVCLIHGIYTFVSQQGTERVPVTGPDGQPISLEYLGSGFLASSDGYVVTNRHVAEPWWNDDTVAPLIAQGLLPQFVLLTACFPGRASVAIDPATIRLSKDTIDIAVMRVSLTDVPVLPLHAGDLTAFRGRRVIVLGYPTGLNAMLARAEPDLVTDVMAKATDTASLIDALASRNAISPVITQGALNEVRPRRLVYDAETTSGGSGGPVFGPDGTVIGVNFAITRDFDGSNFGVPIEFARKLLESTE